MNDNGIAEDLSGNFAHFHQVGIVVDDPLERFLPEVVPLEGLLENIEEGEQGNMILNEDHLMLLQHFGIFGPTQQDHVEGHILGEILGKILAFQHIEIAVQQHGAFVIEPGLKQTWFFGSFRKIDAHFFAGQIFGDHIHIQAHGNSPPLCLY